VLYAHARISRNLNHSLAFNSYTGELRNVSSTLTAGGPSLHLKSCVHVGLALALAEGQSLPAWAPAKSNSCITKPSRAPWLESLTLEKCLGVVKPSSE